MKWWQWWFSDLKAIFKWQKTTNTCMNISYTGLTTSSHQKKKPTDKFGWKYLIRISVSTARNLVIFRLPAAVIIVTMICFPKEGRFYWYQTFSYFVCKTKANCPSHAWRCRFPCILSATVTCWYHCTGPRNLLTKLVQ